MKKLVRNIINLQNAQKSTGPITPAGKQRSSMNAFKHGLTGNRLILQQHEHEAYTRLTTEITKNLDPQTELERQLVQKIIDTHTRLNRIAALDGNILNFGLTSNETDAPHDDALETIAAQCRSWIENADSFEKLGRYEARLSRQLLQYTKELERLQANRKDEVRKAELQADFDAITRYHDARRKRQQEEEEEDGRQTAKYKTTSPKSASFRTDTPVPEPNSPSPC
jgi:hypothetical protein